MVRIPIHSITDLITNSSTVIYTYSDHSADACRKMIDCILKTFNVGKTCDDVFRLSVDIGDDDARDAVNDCEELPEHIRALNWRERREALNSIVASARRGDGPGWAAEAIRAKREEENDGLPTQTYLTIEPVEERYAELARLVRGFLYSTGHEGFRDG